VFAISCSAKGLAGWTSEGKHVPENNKKEYAARVDVGGGIPSMSRYATDGDMLVRGENV